MSFGSILQPPFITPPTAIRPHGLNRQSGNVSGNYTIVSKIYANRFAAFAGATGIQLALMSPGGSTVLNGVYFGRAATAASKNFAAGFQRVSFDGQLSLAMSATAGTLHYSDLIPFNATFPSGGAYLIAFNFVTGGRWRYNRNMSTKYWISYLRKNVQQAGTGRTGTYTVQEGYVYFVSNILAVK